MTVASVMIDWLLNFLTLCIFLLFLQLFIFIFVSAVLLNIGEHLNKTFEK